MTRTATPAPPRGPADPPPLVIAGHGTRDAAGAAVALALVDRVRGLLPQTRVEAGFVELTPPTIDASLADVLTASPDAVVVPLMIGSGGHVREDIPRAIETGRHGRRDATVVYTRHLGAPAQMVTAARRRIDDARADWDPEGVTVVLVGRGCSVTEANADHVRLARVVEETGGYGKVLPAFIQVTTPTVADALDRAHRRGSRRIVVMPHYLFPGRLSTWVHDAVNRWLAAHPDAQVRTADVIGDCAELAAVVVTRYHEGALRLRTGAASPTDLAGLLPSRHLSPSA